MTPTPDADAGILFRPGASLPEEDVVRAPVVEVTAPQGVGRVGILVCGVFGVLAILRVVGAAVRLPPLPVESRLVDGAYAGLPVDGPGEVAARLQLAAHAALTGAFDRYPDVLGGARELAVVAFVVLLGAVAVVVRPVARPWAFAALLALFVVAGPAVDAVATFGPGLLGAMWTAVGAALLVQRARPARVAGIVAVVAGVLTAPLLVVAVVLVIALVAARDRRTAALGGAAVLLVLGGVLLVVPAPAPTTWWVPLIAAPVVVLGLLRRDLRRAAVALTGVALLGDTALPLLVAGVLVVGTLVVDDLRPRGGAVAAAAWVGLAVVVLPTAWSAPGPGRPHPELAEWIGAATSPDAVLVVPPGVRSELLRDGVPAARLGPAGPLVVVEGVTAAQDRLAQFGTGPARLTVLPADPVAPIPEVAVRSRVGAQLDTNPNLDAPDDVRALLRTGGADPRVLVVLGGLAGRGQISVTALPVVAGEDPARPRHRVVLDGAETATVDWLRAQREPFAPQVTVTPDGLTLTWPLPAPTTVFGR